MPAYFSLSFELNKRQDAVGSFCKALIHSGLAFKSGFLEGADDSFEDIIAWNQGRLDKNFQLGYTEHVSHDYKQMLFDYFDFSEVRSFILNRKRGHTFSFELIVPEDDLLEYIGGNDGPYSVKQKTERMEQLLSVAKKMWASTDVLAIQTGWEASEIPPLAKKIARGIRPQAEPFCIIRSSSLKKGPRLACEYLERDGVLMKDITNWDWNDR